MAFFTSMAGVVVAQNKQALAQSFIVDKKSVTQLSNFIRVNTKKFWKPLAAVGVVGALTYGALVVRSEIQKQREEAKLQPPNDEVENLTATASMPEVGAALDVGMLADLSNLADELMEELELVECLERDPADDSVLLDIELMHKIVECSDEGLKLKMMEKMADQDERRARKRIRAGQIPVACKAMVSKLRTSFPSPDGSALQQKAMALYLAKEGRKLKIRETQLAVLIPRAVAIASVPTNAQIDTRVLMSIEPVRFKYARMAWQGVKNEKSWLSKLVASLPSIQ